jgi:hypothetical protein
MESFDEGARVRWNQSHALQVRRAATSLHGASAGSPRARFVGARVCRNGGGERQRAANL